MHQSANKWPAIYTVVARAGVEPATFRVSVGRSYQLSYLANRKTDNRLSRLSILRATPTGLEPATFAVTGRRANQLRYRALNKAVSPTGFEPVPPP